MSLAPQDLVEKIRAGIVKSGFPLEMSIAKFLRAEGWDTMLGTYFQDFETKKYREFDIVAMKKINTILVYLFIECKKSEEKQLVLYSPYNKDDMVWTDYPKLTPKYIPSTRTNTFDFAGAFLHFHALRNTVAAKSIIITQGSAVVQNNHMFFESFDKLLKKSIEHIAWAAKQNSRRMYFYTLVFDGYMFEISDQNCEDFSLKEIEYGVYEHRTTFSRSDDEDINEASDILDNSGLIEITTASAFSSYLKSVERDVNKINLEALSGWGEESKL